MPNDALAIVTSKNKKTDFVALMFGKYLYNFGTGENINCHSLFIS